MAGIKTNPTGPSARSFIDAVENPGRRSDARAVCAMMERVTGCPPVMWGPTIVGFGSYRDRYASGREGTACRLGFSPRKAQLVLYLLGGFEGEADLLARLGKHRVGKCCLYINKLADVDAEVLEALTRACWAWMERRFPDATAEGGGDAADDSPALTR